MAYKKRPPKFPQEYLSPSSIGMYLQCKRKYYNRYCLGIDDSYRFALVRGSMVHKCIEDFFFLRAKDFEPDENDDYEQSFCDHMENFFSDRWNERSMHTLCKKDDLDYDLAKRETLESLLTFARIQWFNIRGGYRKMGNFGKSWFFLKPKFSERKIKSERLHLRGVIDAIIELNDNMHIVDYKTSTIFKLPYSDEYKRQLTMYSLLLRENEGTTIYHVSNFYLKYGIQSFYTLTDKDIDECEQLVLDTYDATRSTDVADYPCNTAYIFCKQKWCSQCTPDCPVHEDYIEPEKLSPFAIIKEEEEKDAVDE